MHDFLLLRVDFGYAFDYLSILKVKMLKNPTPQNINNFKNCSNYLQEQINDDKLWFIIITSSEFDNLTMANMETFEAVEQARYGTISAKIVDNCNMNRFYCKKTIQEKFLPDINVTETKT